MFSPKQWELNERQRNEQPYERKANKRPNTMQPNKQMVESVALYVCVPMQKTVAVNFLFHISIIINLICRRGSNFSLNFLKLKYYNQ